MNAVQNISGSFPLFLVRNIFNMLFTSDVAFVFVFAFAQYERTLRPANVMSNTKDYRYNTLSEFFNCTQLQETH